MARPGDRAVAEADRGGRRLVRVVNCGRTDLGPKPPIPSAIYLNPAIEVFRRREVEQRALALHWSSWSPHDSDFINLTS